MRYLIIHPKSRLNKVLYEELINFFKNLFGISIITEQLENIVIINYDYEQNDLKEIIDSLNYELIFDISVFASKKFDSASKLNAHKEIILDVILKNIYLLDKTYYDEKEFFKCFLNDDNAKKLNELILGKYFNDDEFYTIVRIFLECNLNIKKTSEKLYMHRNTLINKIDKFYTDTNYDLRNFFDAYIVYKTIKN